MDKYLIDIDNTICTTEGGDYENAKPINDRIEKINKLVDEGNQVIYWTARGSESGINWDDLTIKQLKEWGAKYHSLGHKPFANFYIDDRAINSNEFFNNKICPRCNKEIISTDSPMYYLKCDCSYWEYDENKNYKLIKRYE